MDCISLKNTILTLIGVIGSSVACCLGGWDNGLETLIIFIFIDYFTGIISAAIFHNSGKTDSGKLNSQVGWTGLMRKVLTVVVVWVSYRLDLTLGTTFIKDLAVISFITNELISIVENLGKCRVPIPKIILKAIDMLNEKIDKGK